MPPSWHRFAKCGTAASSLGFGTYRSGSLEAPREKIRTFLADKAWQFPSIHKHKSGALHRMFDPRRILSEDPAKLKGSCSEFLGLFGLLRHWVEVDVPAAEELLEARRSFFKLCDILGTILQIKRGIVDPAVGAQTLMSDCSEYLHLHKVRRLPQAWWPQSVRVEGQIFR